MALESRKCHHSAQNQKLHRTVSLDFFEKNLKIQFDVIFDSESNGGIFDSLAPFGCDVWRFENLKFVRQLQPTQKFFG